MKRGEITVKIIYRKGFLIQPKESLRLDTVLRLFCHCEHIHGACTERIEVLSVNSAKQSDTRCHSERSEESNGIYSSQRNNLSEVEAHFAMTIGRQFKSK